MLSSLRMSSFADQLEPRQALTLGLPQARQPAVHRGKAMPKRTRRLLISFIVIAAIAVGAFLFSPGGQSRWQSLFPKVAATGDEFTVASRTLAFSVNATG